MPRTAADHQKWWLNQAELYERHAQQAIKPAQRADAERRAAAARAHAATYTTLPAAEAT